MELSLQAVTVYCRVGEEQGLIAVLLLHCSQMMPHLQRKMNYSREFVHKEAKSFATVKYYTHLWNYCLMSLGWKREGGTFSEGVYRTSGERKQPQWSGQETFSLKVCGDVVKSRCSGVWLSLASYSKTSLTGWLKYLLVRFGDLRVNDQWTGKSHVHWLTMFILHSWNALSWQRGRDYSSQVSYKGH